MGLFGELWDDAKHEVGGLINDGSHVVGGGLNMLGYHGAVARQYAFPVRRRACVAWQ